MAGKQRWRCGPCRRSTQNQHPQTHPWPGPGRPAHAANTTPVSRAYGDPDLELDSRPQPRTRLQDSTQAPLRGARWARPCGPPVLPSTRPCGPPHGRLSPPGPQNPRQNMFEQESTTPGKARPVRGGAGVGGWPDNRAPANGRAPSRASSAAAWPPGPSFSLLFCQKGLVLPSQKRQAQSQERPGRARRQQCPWEGL